MKRIKTYLGLVIVAMLVSACNDPSEGSTSTGIPLAGRHSATELAGKAEAGVQITATLATLGSFEWDAAPITNKAADTLIGIPLALKKHEISKTEAQQRIDQADKAHALVQKALKTCNQDPKPPAHCRGDEKKARALLDEAKAVLSAP